MEHNPLAEELRLATAELTRLLEDRSELETELSWRRDFDRSAGEQTVIKYQATRDALEADRAAIQARLESAVKQTRGLEATTELGWDPTYWLSKKRAQAKKRWQDHRLELARLETQKATLTDELADTQHSLDAAQRDIARFDKIDAAQTAAALANLDTMIALRQPEVDSLSERKEDLDRQLKAPVEVLEGLQAELSRLEGRRRDLLQLVGDCEQDIERAQKFKKALSLASDKSERWEIHHDCEATFGTGRPGDVISARRSGRDEARREISSIDRQLVPVRRNVTKARERVTTVGTRGAREVRALVIDGNNVCYEGSTFIRLAALAPLCRQLLDFYEVTVVFDDSIRRLLGTDDAALREAIPGSNVHVVASRATADETILAVAEDPFTYVLSRDRFAEFAEKPAVRDGRVLHHEILNGRILVHDLNIIVPFGPDA